MLILVMTRERTGRIGELARGRSMSVDNLGMY